MINVLAKRLFTLLILVSYGSASFAVSISELVREEKIIATSYVNANEPVAIASQVTLTIDISIPIDAKFSQGTLISHFEIPDAIVLAQGPFAMNSVTRIKGKRYINQLWEIPIFPQAAGEYVIPPIVIEMGIEHNNETITGKLLTSPLAFSAFTPSPYITDEHHWIVANQATLEENIIVTNVNPSDVDNDEAQQLFVGDAIEREVNLTAEGSLAMLFPTLINADDYKEMGAKAYLSQGESFDKENRGTRTSSHTEKVTLVVQEAGTIVLPAIEVVWWDLENNSENRLLLASQEWEVKHTLSSYLQAYWMQILAIIILLCLFVFGLYRLHKEITHRKETDTMPFWYQFGRAIKAKNWGRSESVIYRKIKRDQQRLTLSGKGPDGWEDDVAQLQSARYQSPSSVVLKKSLFVRLWEKLG